MHIFFFQWEGNYVIILLAKKGVTYIHYLKLSYKPPPYFSG